MEFIGICILCFIVIVHLMKIKCPYCETRVNPQTVSDSTCGDGYHERCPQCGAIL